MTLQEAREARGWTPHEAARRAKIGDESLKRLERGDVAPGKVSAGVMISLLTLYYPDVTLDDFMGERLLLRVSPNGARGSARLMATTTSQSLRQEMRS